MLRIVLAAAALLLPTAAAYGDPEPMCGLEDSPSTRTPCPPQVTYDEEGNEVGGHR